MLTTSRARKRAIVIGGVCTAAVVASAGAATAGGLGWWAAQSHGFSVRADKGSVKGGSATGNLLSNDHGATAVVSHSALSNPSAGQLTVDADGSYRFTPAAGAHGTATFTYSATDAVTLYKDAGKDGEALPPFGTLEGPDGTQATISGGGFGSSFAPAPGKPGWFYGVTDRGPNADDDGDGNKVFTDPTFVPEIGYFHLVGGKAVLQKTIQLKAPDGTPYNGLPVPITKTAASAEKTEDLTGAYIDPTQSYTIPAGIAGAGTVLDPDLGYDSEGLAVMKDGSFWISDEYGPFITHFDKNGKELDRLSPWGADGQHQVDTAHPLPLELQLRTKNKGMEGLTVTPDGSTLVGIMQSALTQGDLGSAKTANIAPVRIVTYNVKTKAMHEYLYLLTNPKVNVGDAVSEITALSDTKFLVDERDGNQAEPGAAAFKDLYEIDLTGATDVLSGAGYTKVTGSDTVLDKTKPQGLLVDGKSIEGYVGDATTSKAEYLLRQAGIQPVSKTPYLEMGTLVNDLDPSGAFFGHDKIEGIATPDGGKTLYLSNDSDFGMDHLLGVDEAACEASGLSDTTACAPAKSPTTGLNLVHQKTLDASGVVDDGELLQVNVAKLPAVLRTATVTITY